MLGLQGFTSIYLCTRPAARTSSTVHSVLIPVALGLGPYLNKPRNVSQQLRVGPGAHCVTQHGAIIHRLFCVTLIRKLRFPKCHIIECGREPAAVHSDVHVDSNTVNNK